MFGQRCYKIPNCRFVPFGVRTDTHSHTAVRAPGMVNGAGMMEAIMEHAAGELGLDALDFKLNNLMEKGDPVMPPPFTLRENHFIFVLNSEMLNL